MVGARDGGLPETLTSVNSARLTSIPSNEPNMRQSRSPSASGTGSRHSLAPAIVVGRPNPKS